MAGLASGQFGACSPGVDQTTPEAWQSIAVRSHVPDAAGAAAAPVMEASPATQVMTTGLDNSRVAQALFIDTVTSHVPLSRAMSRPAGQQKAVRLTLSTRERPQCLARGGQR